MKNIKKHKLLITLLIVLFILVISGLVTYKHFHKEVKIELDELEVSMYTNENLLDGKASEFQEEYITECNALSNSTDLLTTFNAEFKDRFTGTGSTAQELQIYNKVISYISEEITFGDLETELITQIGETDGTEAIELRAHIHLLQQFFYTNNKGVVLDCEDILNKYYY